MAISGVSSFSTLPPLGSTSGTSSNTQLPTDPKDNKKAVAQMFEQSFFERQKEMYDKAKAKAEKAMKGDTSCDAF
jgi:hypothetical protein